MKFALPELVVHNFWLKFFSVALATVIWLGIHYDSEKETSLSQIHVINRITVPISTKAEQGDKRAFKITPSEAVVFVQGDDKALLEGIRAYVDLRAVHAARSEAEEVHVDAPPDLEIVSISPPTVAVDEVTNK